MLRNDTTMNETRKKTIWKDNAQIAHLVFANTQRVNPKKNQKSYFFTNPPE